MVTCISNLNPGKSIYFTFLVSAKSSPLDLRPPTSARQISFMLGDIDAQSSAKPEVVLDVYPPTTIKVSPEVTAQPKEYRGVHWGPGGDHHI